MLLLLLRLIQMTAKKEKSSHIVGPFSFLYLPSCSPKWLVGLGCSYLYRIYELIHPRFYHGSANQQFKKIIIKMHLSA